MVKTLRKSKEESPSRIKILQAAQLLMLRKGYTATTIDQICEEAGITKGSFFHHFSSKEQLATVVLDYYWTNLQGMIDETIFQKKDPLARIYNFLDFTIKIYQTPLFESSCLLGNLAQEISATNEELRQLCDSYLSRQVEIIKKQFDEAIEFHSASKNIDTHSLASSLVAVIQGSIILAKVGNNKSVISNNLEHYKKYIKMLFKK